MPEEQIKPVPMSVPDKAERGRSTIEWPYFSLDEVVKLAKGIYELGGSCTIDQLAGHMNQAASGGAFRLKVQAARTFGLIKSSQGGKLSLSDLGHQIIDAESASAARVDAFLTVPLYKALYDAYKGKPLPPPGGLEGAIVNLGVIPTQKEKARQAFQRSAKDAGFFAYGSSKLVYPVLPVPIQHAATSPPRPEEPLHHHETPPQRTSARDGGGGGDRRHSLIEGLLDELPDEKTEWPLQRRQEWLQTAAGVFNLIYKVAPEDKGTVQVSVKLPNASSAN